MAILRVQRIQAGKTLQAKDATVNTFYFDTGGDETTPAVGTMNSICTELDTFFNTAVGGGNAVRFYMGESTMSADQNSYKVFNMDHPTPRAPVAAPAAQNMTPQITTTPLPSEVACCLSFRGALVSGTAPGRRRGRVFIGPLNTNAVAWETASGHARPVSGLLTALTAGANRLKDNLAALAIVWCVYSPTSRGGGAASAGCTPCSYAWVDDAFDTQRRRGIKAGTRTAIVL